MHDLQKLRRDACKQHMHSDPCGVDVRSMNAFQFFEDMTQTHGQRNGLATFPFEILVGSRVLHIHGAQRVQQVKAFRHGSLLVIYRVPERGQTMAEMTAVHLSPPLPGVTSVAFRPEGARPRP